MLTYTSGRNLFGTLTNNSSTTNLTFGDTFINQFTLELVHKFPFLFGEQTFTLQTYPSQQFYTLPLQLRKLATVQINVGNTGGTTTTGAGFNWPVEECPTQQYWNQLNLTNNISSDIPQYFIYLNNQLGIYPKPAGGYNPITVRGEVEVAGISVADYTTGTITAVPYALTLTGAPASGAVSATLTATWTLATGTYQMIFSSEDNRLVTLTSGSAAVTWDEELSAAATTAVTIRTADGGEIVVGSGSTWTTAMQGRVFNIAQPTGDGFWYTIDTVYDTTHLSLVTSYGGANIAAGSSTYTIGQASIIPPAYQLIPVYRSAELYFTIISKDAERQTLYKGLADGLEGIMKDDYGNKSTDPTVQDDFGTQMINPNLTINTTQSTGT